MVIDHPETTNHTCPEGSRSRQETAPPQLDTAAELADGTLDQVGIPSCAIYAPASAKTAWLASSASPR